MILRIGNIVLLIILTCYSWSIHAKGKDFIFESWPSKHKVYVGEGINLKYYLFSKFARTQFEIIQFPKLTGFLKRFVNEWGPPVNYKIGKEKYWRSSKYSARIYPRTSGKIVIDSMILNINHMIVQSNGDLKQLTKKLVTKEIPIEVLELPNENRPISFSGLIGKHQIYVHEFPTEVYINRPFTIKLLIKGPGALEFFAMNFEINNESIELISKREEFSFYNFQYGEKLFTYQFLPKRVMNLDVGPIEYSYFQPDEKKYISKKLKFPKLEIKVDLKNNSKKIELVGPLFSYKMNFLGRVLNEFHWFLFLPLIFAFFIVLDPLKKFLKPSPKEILWKDMIKNGPTYTHLFNLFQSLYCLSKSELDTLKEGTLDGWIKNGGLSVKSTSYFLDLKEKLEKNDFQRHGKSEEIDINKNHEYWKELKKLFLSK